MKRYALKGINDDRTECTVCGKVELKRVMWLVELDAEGTEIGDAFHCGTTCGAKLMGRKIAVVNTAVKNFDAEVRKIRERMWYQSEWYANRQAELEAAHGMPFAERKSSGLLDRLNGYERSFSEWFAQQNVLVEVA
jgi:hypothetical protein